MKSNVIGDRCGMCDLVVVAEHPVYHDGNLRNHAINFNARPAVPQIQHDISIDRSQYFNTVSISRCISATPGTTAAMRPVLYGI